MNYANVCLKPFRKNSLKLLFARTYFRYLFENTLKLEMADFHEDIASKFLNDDLKQVFIQAARGHGKSELNIAFCIFLLLTKGSKNPQPFSIVLASATDRQVKKLVQRISNYITCIDILRDYLYPENIHEAKWNEGEMITKNNVQLIGRPLKSSMRGLHVDIAIFDDILTDEVADIEGAKDIFNGVAQPIVRTKKGRMIIVGTPMSYDDLFSDLFDLEKYPTASHGFYPALNSDGEPTWHERFTKEELDIVERNLGPIKWSREYMLRPIGSGSMLFSEALINTCIDKDCKYADKTDETDYFLGCDIAFSTKKSADYSVFTVIERNPKKPLRVIEIWREQGVPMNEQLDVIRNLHERYNFTKITIEKIGLSYGMVDVLEQDFFTRSVTDAFVTNIRNKEDIISRLHVLMKNDQLKFFEDKDLKEELASFGVKKKRDGTQTYESLWKHDDMVISLALACYAAEQSVSTYDFEFI